MTEFGHSSAIWRKGGTGKDLRLFTRVDEDCTNNVCHERSDVGGEKRGRRSEERGWGEDDRRGQGEHRQAQYSDRDWRKDEEQARLEAAEQAWGVGVERRSLAPGTWHLAGPAQQVQTRGRDRKSVV